MIYLIIAGVCLLILAVRQTYKAGKLRTKIRAIYRDALRDQREFKSQIEDLKTRRT